MASSSYRRQIMVATGGLDHGKCDIQTAVGPSAAAKLLALLAVLSTRVRIASEIVGCVGTDMFL